MTRLLLPPHFLFCHPPRQPPPANHPGSLLAQRNLPRADLPRSPTKPLHCAHSEPHHHLRGYRPRVSQSEPSCRRTDQTLGQSLLDPHPSTRLRSLAHGHRRLQHAPPAPRTGSHLPPACLRYLPSRAQQCRTSRQHQPRLSGPRVNSTLPVRVSSSSRTRPPSGSRAVVLPSPTTARSSTTARNGMISYA